MTADRGKCKHVPLTTAAPDGPLVKVTSVDFTGKTITVWHDPARAFGLAEQVLAAAREALSTKAGGE